VKAIQDAGPKMIEKLAESGIDLGSLDVFLGNGNEQGDKSFSPLDSPDKVHLLSESGVTGAQQESNEIITGGSAKMMYFSNSDSSVDLLI
jgi:hypothetical protein